MRKKILKVKLESPNHIGFICELVKRGSHGYPINATKATYAGFVVRIVDTPCIGKVTGSKGTVKVVHKSTMFWDDEGYMRGLKSIEGCNINSPLDKELITALFSPGAISYEDAILFNLMKDDGCELVTAYARANPQPIKQSSQRYDENINDFDMTFPLILKEQPLHQVGNYVITAGCLMKDNPYEPKVLPHDARQMKFVI